MPFLPSGNVDSFQAADLLINSAIMMRNAIDPWILNCDNPPLDANVIVNSFLLRQLKPFRANWGTWTAIAGYQAAVRSRLSGFADDAAVTTATTAVKDGADTLISYLETNLQNAFAATVASFTGLVLFNISNGVVVNRTVTNGTQLANLKTQLQAFRGTLTT